MCQTPASFSFVVGLKRIMQYLQQIDVQIIRIHRCWGSNSRPLVYESLPMTTRPWTRGSNKLEIFYVSIKWSIWNMNENLNLKNLNFDFFSVLFVLGLSTSLLKFLQTFFFQQWSSLPCSSTWLNCPKLCSNIARTWSINSYFKMPNRDKSY